MLYLASTSPRRRDLLNQLGLEFQVLSVHVDESVQPHELASHYVERLARAKAHAGFQQRQSASDLVLAADTTVVLDGHIIGKPENYAQARDLWQQMSGRAHQVLTGIALANQQAMRSQVVSTEVYFKPLCEAEMHAYWHTGEPQDKAGGYGIQGRGALFVQKIIGSYSNVVGLPLVETAQLLTEFDYPIW
ncbi:Maf family protein [Agitococcus lubricus]|uniref:dTTP/UTP pyrophosphatase n=1 Tax=Agitococcus lubricus TaxID=1077255 RepID=A0A2T5ITM9_9GAMM|nr:Maf family protein [Agitococcus lubricus]PTQ87236.1 septum formation protein [Agitococcus lubricus]